MHAHTRALHSHQPSVYSNMYNRKHAPCLALMQERLEREYNLFLITTAPTVIYQCITTEGEELMVNSPADLPDVSAVCVSVCVCVYVRTCGDSNSISD
jgi:hypothetical protein